MAWARRPNSRLGFLLVVAGGALMLGELGSIETAATAAIGAVTQTLVLAVIVHLLLSFPTGRLRGSAERVVVVAGYVVCSVLQAPLYLFAPDGALSVADRPGLVDAGLQAQRAGAGLVVLAAAVILAGRMRRADPEQRRILVPLGAYGIFALLFTLLISPISDILDDLVLRVCVQLGLIGLIPIVLVLAASRGGFARTGDIGELGAWLGADDADRPGLRAALAATLGDPTVQVRFRVPGEETLVDELGLPVGVATGAGGRASVDVELAGRVVGAIEYDGMLLDRPEEVREAARIVALALDRERLTVELRASRARIAAAADGERRRIVRDLHDGLQSRLVLLAMEAGANGAPAALRGGLQSAIEELRELVDGVMPAQLTERGLPAAVEDLGDRLPIPIELRVTGMQRRLRPDVETAAYLVVSEAIVNAVKHADPARLVVSIERAGAHVALAVEDDGRGGVRTGSGMRGMADRVEALGGRLQVDSVTGSGTRIRAVIPCAS